MSSLTTTFIYHSKVVKNMKDLSERELYENLSDNEKIKILRGFHENITRTTTETTLQPTPGRQTVSKKILHFVDKTGLPKNSKIVSLGCAEGINCFGLYEQGYTETTGIDINTENLELAKQTNTEKGHNIDFRYGDITDTKLDGNTYDIAISYLVLMTLRSRDDIKKSAEEIKRILKPNGYLILSTMSTESFERYSDALDLAWNRYMGNDETGVLHGGHIYLSREDVLEVMFPDFEIVEELEMPDDYRRISNYCMLMRYRCGE